MMVFFALSSPIFSGERHCRDFGLADEDVVASVSLRASRKTKKYLETLP